LSRENRGYDVESRDGKTGRLRMIEVKGRVEGAESVTVTRNEIVAALNRPGDFILAVVEVAGDSAREPRYVRRPFGKEPDFNVQSVTTSGSCSAGASLRVDRGQSGRPRPVE
jgi:hypothetical protein